PATPSRTAVGYAGPSGSSAAAPVAAAAPASIPTGTVQARSPGQRPSRSTTALTPTAASVATTAPELSRATGTQATPQARPPRPSVTDATDSTSRGRPSRRSSWCTRAATTATPTATPISGTDPPTSATAST